VPDAMLCGSQGSMARGGGVNTWFVDYDTNMKTIRELLR
jgi:hypothetical protein